MALPAYPVRVMIAGGPVPFTTEAASGAGVGPYQIDDVNLRIWDYATALQVFDGGAPVAAADIESVNYHIGSVTFVNPPAGAVTFTGASLPTTRVAEGRSFEISKDEELLDATVFDDDFHRKWVYGLEDQSGSLESLAMRHESSFLNAIQNRVPLLLEISVFPETVGHRFWALVESDTQSGSVSDLVTNSYTFKSAPQRDTENRPIVPYFGQL